jgi:hypothetical protein
MNHQCRVMNHFESLRLTKTTCLYLRGRHITMLRLKLLTLPLLASLAVTDTLLTAKYTYIGTYYIETNQHLNFGFLDYLKTFRVLQKLRNE